MEIHRSLGVSRLVALMSASRGRSTHERLLACLDRSLAEARDLCDRAEQLYPEGEFSGAFETVLVVRLNQMLHTATCRRSQR
jgi:hypothetical protein